MIKIITDINQLNQPCEDTDLLAAFDIISKLEDVLKNSQPAGIGLAANQIGINKRVAIVRLGTSKINLVNPEIIKTYDILEFREEGCLSFPGESIITKRFNEILVKDLLHPAGMIFTGIEAVVVQHEIDHTNSKTMFDFEIEIPQRNQKCWCGSKKKYKKCHWRSEINIKVI